MKKRYIKLTELMHSIGEEKKNGLINIDDWRWPDVEHLGDMGFEFTDDYHMSTNPKCPEDPLITISKKKELDEASGKKSSYFYIEEPKRGTKRFKDFNDVIEYFDNYRQPELEKNME